MENLTVASFCILLRLSLQQLTVVALWPYVGVPGAQALPLYCTLVKVDTASIGACVSWNPWAGSNLAMLGGNCPQLVCQLLVKVP